MQRKKVGFKEEEKVLDKQALEERARRVLDILMSSDVEDDEVMLPLTPLRNLCSTRSLTVNIKTDIFMNRGLKR